MHMHWQSMLERRDRFFGNIIFYDYLYKTKRLPFLERNRKQVQQGLSHSQSEDQYSQTGPRFRSQWQPPSWDLLDDMISAEKSGGSFVLEVHSIRPLNAPEASQNARSNDPARKVRNILRLTTSIKTSIVSSSTMSTCKNPPDQEATLRGFDRSEKEASIEVEPIVIDRESWYTDPTKIDDNDIHMMG